MGRCTFSHTNLFSQFSFSVSFSRSIGSIVPSLPPSFKRDRRLSFALSCFPFLLDCRLLSATSGADRLWLFSCPRDNVVGKPRAIGDSLLVFTLDTYAYIYRRTPTVLFFSRAILRMRGHSVFTSLNNWKLITN